MCNDSLILLQHTVNAPDGTTPAKSSQMIKWANSPVQAIKNACDSISEMNRPAEDSKQEIEGNEEEVQDRAEVVNQRTVEVWKEHTLFVW